MKNKYYSEGKYRCNHPESDFEETSTNPIEMKKENFVEYTHRNETANYRYDVWNNTNNKTLNGLYNAQSDSNKSLNETYAKYLNSNYTKINNTKSKKKNSFSLIIFIIVIYFIPIIFELIFSILE